MVVMNRSKYWWLGIFVILGVCLMGFMGLAARKTGKRWPAGSQVVRAVDASAMLAQTFRAPSGGKLNYRLLVPAEYDAHRKYPLVVSLHGMGGEGSDNKQQLTSIVSIFFSAESRRQFPCFLMAPQCPPHTTWVDRRAYLPSGLVRQPAQPTAPTRQTLELIAALPRAYSIDPNRVYLIGYSSGAIGAWDMLSRRPDLFAAGVPLCGRGDPTKAVRMARVPIWTFHGSADAAISVNCTRAMVRALRAAGGHPRYTEYPGAGHDAGWRALQEPSLLPWIFAQRR